MFWMWLMAGAFASEASVEPSTRPVVDDDDVSCVDDTASRAVELAATMEEAYRAADLDGVLNTNIELDDALGCLIRPLERSEIVQIHRAKALYYFVAAAPAASRASWAAVQQLDPTWRIEDLHSSPTHPLVQVWKNAPRELGTVELNRKPPGGWFFDGMPASDQAPDNRAFVAVGRNADSSLWFSGHLLDVAELPTAPLDERARKRRRTAIRISGTALGGGLAVTGTTFLALGLADRTAMQQPDFPYDEIDAVGERRNTRLNVGFATLGPGLVISGLAWGIPW